MLFNIEGKRILITGSSGGIGYVLAEGLASAGASVILNGRSKEKVDTAVQSISNQGFRVNGFVFDITNSEEVEQNISDIENALGNIDVLVNNAGIQQRGALEEFSLEDWNKVLNVNLTGAFIVSKAVAKGMIERKGGKIINICSLQSNLARPYHSSLCCCKRRLKNAYTGNGYRMGKT